MYYIRVPSNSTMDDFLDPRFEDEALSALMEEAFSETKEEKYDVESYLNGDFDYA